MSKKVYEIDISQIIEEVEFEEEEQEANNANDEQNPLLPDYGSPEFWEKRYKIEFLPFDWYIHWKELGPIIDPYIPQGKEKLRSLVVGCGNSTMSNDMVEMSGFKNVVSIDISGAVIEKMKRKYKSDDLEWIQMDVANMSFDNETFDMVFDKGTIDALTCSDDDYKLAKKSLCEIYRILKVNGVLYMITYEKPINRIPLIKYTKIPWKIGTSLFIPNSSTNANEDQGTYVYMFQK